MPRWHDPAHEPRRVEGGLAVPAGAILPGLRGRTAGMQLTVGPGSRIRGPLENEGSITLAARCRVEGDVASQGTVTVGPGARVGGVRAARIVVQAGARTGDLQAAGDVLLLGGCEVGQVAAGGDILVAGAPKAAGLQPKGRIVTRAW